MRAGLAVSTAGRDGGYALARESERITLLEVVRSVEGDVVPTSCVLRGEPCRWDDICAFHVWVQARYALLDSIEGTSLANLVAINVALKAGTYEVPVEVQRSRSNLRPKPVTRRGSSTSP